MAANKKLLILPGDGIGPEVMGEVSRVIDWMDRRRHVSFDVAEDKVGGAAYYEYGTSLAYKTLETAMGVDAVLLGAVGGPKWDNVERHLRPEAGLLKIRNAANSAFVTVGTLADTNLGLASLAGATFTGDVILGTTSSLELPDGTTAQRPGSPVNGMIRYNTTLNQFEGYKAAAWGAIGGGATGGGSDDVFYENGQTITTSYTLTASKNAMSAGPVTINSSVTVTIPSGASWVVV